MLQFNYKWFVTALLVSIFGIVEAKTLQVSVKLTSIVVKKTSEKDGDELYFGINEYSNKKISSYTRMPAFPSYWKSQNLSQLKDQLLWHEKIQDGEAVQLVISLLEHDLPPWNLDDHIGTVKLLFRNDQGKIYYKWSIPNLRDHNESIQARNGTFILKGDKSEYHLKLNVIAHS